MSRSNFDAENFDRQVIKCNVCLEWCHRKCERIPDITFSPNVNWACRKCKEISWIITRAVFLEKVLIGKNSKI